MPQLSEFLGGYQRGVEVAVASSVADELLGVREAFRRYFHDTADRPVPVAVVPQEVEISRRGIAESDAEAIGSARSLARSLAARFESNYQFYVATETAIQSLEEEGTTRFLLRTWSVVIGPAGEAAGAGGTLELPARLVDGTGPARLSAALPGTRRAGGLTASLTGGLESRRTVVALATLNALSTLFYGLLEHRRGHRA